jgi:hypothetical protein
MKYGDEKYKSVLDGIDLSGKSGDEVYKRYTAVVAALRITKGLSSDEIVEGAVNVVFADIKASGFLLDSAAAIDAIDACLSAVTSSAYLPDPITRSDVIEMMAQHFNGPAGEAI